MLKLSDGRPMSCLLESVEGGAVRGRYSIIGIAPDIVWRACGRERRDQHPAADARACLRARGQAAHSSPCGRCWLPRASSCRTNCRRSPPASSATWATTPSARSSACPTSRRTPWRSRWDVRAPDHHGGVRCREGRDDRRHAGAAEARHRRANRLRARARSPAQRRARAGRAAAACYGHVRHPSGAAGSRLQHHARRVHGHGGAGQGLHRRRRHLPGRAVAALLGALQPAPARALPGAAPHQPLAVPVPSRFRRLRAGRLQPGNPGARAQRRSDDTPSGRHAPARRHARPRTRRWRRNCSPIPRSAPST